MFSRMKNDRKAHLVVILALLQMFILIGCNNASSNLEEANESVDISSKTLAIVSKGAGNLYNEIEAEGYEEVIEEAGATCIVVHPENTTVEEQITEIGNLVVDGVNALAVCANDEDALGDVLYMASQAGVVVTALDSNVNPKSRLTFVNQVGTEEIASALMKGVLDITGGEGQWAILSATSQVSNQNAWIAKMKEIMEEEEYSGLSLVDIVYGDDEYNKSVSKTKQLLNKYPDLKVICSPTVVGMYAAAETITQANATGRVKLTGLGLPSQMADYIGYDTSHCCPYMYLWNPKDVGRLSAYTSIALLKGDITGVMGEKFIAGDMGEYEITEALDGGTEIILGPPLKFDESNIDYWKDLY